MKRVIILFGILLGFSKVWAQEMYTQSYSDKNGLPDNEVFDIHQDKRGYLWIAGNSGLVRFSGNEFKSFTSPGQRMPALADMQAMADGSLWMHDFGDRIFVLNHDSLKYFPIPEQVGGGFPTLASDPSGTYLWIAWNSKILLYQTSKPSLIKQFPIKTNRSIYADKTGLWVSSESAFVHINKQGEQHVFPLKNVRDVQRKLTDKVFFMERNGQVYAYLRSSKELLVLQSGHFIPMLTLTMLPDITGIRNLQNQLWFLTRNGCYSFSADFKYYTQLFKGVAVSDMLMDDEHSLWIASLDQGLLQVPNQNITVFPIAGTGSKGICKLGFWENQLVGGSLEGSLLTWKQGNSTVLIPSQEKKEVSFLQTENGKLWFGTNNLMRYDGKKLETLSPNPGTKQLFPLNANYLLAAGSDGLSLVSTGKGHELPDWLKPYAKEINTKKTYFARFHTLRSWSVWANDSLQTLFCAGKNGLIRYKKGKDELMQFEGEPVYASSLDGNRKQVLIGTHNQGVLMYSLGNEELNQVKSLSNLFENSSVYLVKWQDPYWILVGAKSVVVWNPQTQQQTELSRESGLLSGRVYDALIKDKHLLLAGSSGLFSYPIASLKDNYGKARFQVKSINGVAFEPGKAIEIGLNRQLNLVVDKIGFRQRDQISLQYRLNEGALITLHPSEQSLSINSLPYGESILYLRAINKLNQKKAEEIRIALIVATPIYLQVWFLSCCLLLSLGFGIFMWQFRLNQLKKKNAELLEKEQLNHALKSSMLASIKSQMNPHFLFNALNTIQSFILQNDRMNANFYLGKFSDLMRKILGMSTRDTIQLEEELEALKLYLELENMRFNGSLIYEIDLPNEEILELEIPSMIIQPYVENAIKHGLLHSQKERRLQIRFSLEKENVLKVEVEDNGIGRQAAEQIKSRLFKGSFQSFSTEANKRRLELLNEQLATHIGVEYIDKAEHQQAQGTLVRLFIPFS